MESTLNETPVGVPQPITRHQLTSLRHWTGTAFLLHKKRCSKNRSVCKNAVTLVRELHDPTYRLLAIAFPRWPIFKMVSFLEYLVFFGAVFCTEQLYCSCRIVFRMFLAFLIFDPNWQFRKGYSLCMGYSLCKMADFQNGLISRIFRVFWSGFLHRTQRVWALKWVSLQERVRNF